MQCLQDTNPIRNTSLKQWVAHVLKEESVDCASEGSEEEESAKPTKQWGKQTYYRPAKC